MKEQATLILSAFMLVSSPLSSAFADGEQNGGNGSSIVSEGTKTSKQLYDKRLPPVIPGQEVQANGKKMNVWSTSGGVPVSQPPQPWHAESGDVHINGNGVGVVVDSRDRARPGN